MNLSGITGVVQAVTLASRADVDHMVPGVTYTTHSQEAAYFPAVATIEAQRAELLGEIYDVSGRQVVLRLGHARLEARQEPAAKRTITIGAEFFVTALKDYKDWRIKWWREAIQNAVDAGARNVDLGSRQDPDGTMTVWCDDDGSGMDEQTILNKFLVLGGTTKIGDGGVAGGFGKAKELLLLPWIGWKIHSRETIVDGSGIDYTTSRAPMRKGTRLEVAMPADKNTDGAVAIAFVQRCDLPNVSFKVNGEPVKAALSGGRLVQSVTGKVDLYFIPSSERQPDLYVRAKGLYMFDRYIGDIPGFLIAELTAPSIDILTANRDGFRDWMVAREIDELGERIAKDTRSALRGGNLLRQKFEGTGKFRARDRAADLLYRIGPRPAVGALTDQNTDALVQAVNDFAKREGEQQQGQVGGLPSPDGARAMLDQKFLGPDQLEAAIKQLVWEPDFFLVNDVESFTIPKKFFPATMTPTVLKLAKSWVELVRYVMMQLGSDEKFGVGFIFSEETAAAALSEKSREGDREQWVMLNPVKDLRSLRGDISRMDVWRPAQDQDLKWLYAAAIHECTHIADGLA
jgi:hypothetical protein